MKQILPDFFTFTGLMVGRVYAIKSDDGLTLIDASISPSGSKILKQITAAGYTAKDIKRILITHAHPDHVGALPLLVAESEAQVYASTIDTPVVEGQAEVVRNPGPIRPPKTILKGAPVAVQLEDEDTINGLDGWQALLTPGHSPGHLAFWQAEQRILIAGDTMFHVFGITQPPGFLTVDAAQNRQSILRLADLKPDTLCFGHGQPIVHNAAAQLDKFADKIRALVTT